VFWKNMYSSLKSGARNPVPVEARKVSASVIRYRAATRGVVCVPHWELWETRTPGRMLTFAAGTSSNCTKGSIDVVDRSPP
jgi:hypothetical protein